MTDISNSAAAGDPGLEEIERAGTTVTPQFAEAFRNMSDADRTIWVEDARRNRLTAEFGWAASFLDDPEIGPILRLAVGPPSWAPAKLLRELEKTKWWQARSRAQRNWDQGIATDPGTYKKSVEDQRENIKSVVSQLNGFLTEEQVTELATESLRSEWTDRQTIAGVAGEMMKGSDNGDVRFGITGRAVRQLSSQYAVPLSNQAADEWARKIATGEMLQTDYETFLRQQAKSLYPSLSADIDRGLTVSTIVDPYSQVAQSTLGVSSDQIDFANPRWNAALNFDDGKGSGRRMMTLFEWGEHLRKDERYGYDRTPNARTKAYSMVSDLGRMFGMTA